MRYVVVLCFLAAACSSSHREDGANLRQPLEACPHSICTTGIALGSSCDACAASVCAADPYCCQAAWDATCVGEVTSICNQSCTAQPDAGADGGDGGVTPSTCTHALCALGSALLPTCDPCATQLCAADPYCCQVGWDATCVGEVSSICGKTCQ
jgi:hypothetical protein